MICPTQAWYLNNSQTKPPTSGDQLRMTEGQEIHAHARSLFPEGAFAGDPQTTETVLDDSSAKTIFEAAFSTDGYAARADILQRQANGFRLIEVKSSLHDDEKINKEHIDDLAYTTMVLRRAGVSIAKTELYLLSRDYRLGMDDTALFIATDHTAAVKKRANEFLQFWDDVRDSVLGEERPDPTLIPGCKTCEYYGRECLGKCGVAHPIFELPRLSKKRFDELCAAGIQSIDAIPGGFDLTENQDRVRRAVQIGKPTRDKKALIKLLARIRWPALYLDFETVKTALPLWPDISPHEQIVTQYSVHLCSEPGLVQKHSQYLADSAKDCRRELTERLLTDLQGDGSIVVYSSFEQTILRGLAVRFPDLAPSLEACLRRLFDLERIFKDAYYHPQFHGSTSIKRALPVLVPEMTYRDLAIADGDSAMTAFARMMRGECDAAEMESIRRSLLTYCGQDTLAMVRLHEALVRLVA